MNACGSGHMKTCSIHFHGATCNKNWNTNRTFKKSVSLPHYNNYGGIEMSAAMKTSIFNAFKFENQS